MAYGGPPKEDVGPTQGWSGGPPEAPGPRTRTDAGIQPQGGPATPPERLPADEAQRDAEATAGGGAQRRVEPEKEAGVRLGAREGAARGKETPGPNDDDR